VGDDHGAARELEQSSSSARSLDVQIVGGLVRAAAAPPRANRYQHVDAARADRADIY